MTGWKVLDEQTNLSREREYLIKNATKQGYLVATNGDGIDCSTRLKNHRGTVQKGLSQTIKTQCDVGTIQNNRIIKITPKEAFRLMGFKDQDYLKASKVCSESQLYKQAGNSIAVKTLEHIFKQIL